jgi:hypothetical protein
VHLALVRQSAQGYGGAGGAISASDSDAGAPGGGGRTESASLCITGRPGGRGRVAVCRVVAGGRWRVAQNRIKKSPYSPISQHKKAGGGQHGPWALGFGPVGRGRWAVWRVRLENPLGHGNFLSGLKLSGERDGGLGLARFSVVYCPLGGHMYMYANGLALMARSTQYAGMAGAACMGLTT